MIFLLFTACGSSSTAAWQGQYDLGIQYLTDGDYSAAVVALTAAIETEPKMAALYIARGDAYSAWAEKTTEAALTAVSDGEMVEWSEITITAGDDSTYTLEELYENAISDYEEAIRLIEGGEAVDDSPEELLQEADEKLQKIKDRREESREDYTKMLDELNSSDDEAVVQADGTEGSEESEKSESVDDHLEDYQNYEECSEEEQAVIVMLVDAAVSGDLNSLPELTEIPEITGYFYYDGYKVQITRGYDYGQTNDGLEGYFWPYMIVSVRPQNGIGYCYYIRDDLDWEYVEDGSYGIYRGTDYVICTCENWNWNGEYIQTNTRDNGFAATVNTESGTVVDNIKEGTATVTHQFTYYVPGYDEESSWTVTYEGGHCVDGNGIDLMFSSSQAVREDYWQLEVVGDRSKLYKY
ncbi:MAG: hypothetical protein LUI10_12315 [Lachnospiraceae bacterium]|nr:hypothetical protein [Lachnospiraceae bacterium]